ncbi:MAG: YqzL family protein [Clostridium sp.]|nr:YqzL family protein [Clostridium sp.]MCM1444286.1 YqzL family protein [Candidatus Amulumruptor caecigallinarius]
MEKEILWKLFENTGKIEYYLKYKEIVDGNTSENRRDL